MVTGVVCEFNPFHNGHAHLINEIKKNNDTKVVAFMSGNFVQRGDAAIFDKYSRAKTAVQNGADLVIEIPTVFAVQSAEGFAKASTDLMKASNVVDSIAFGAECADSEKLKEVADFLKNGQTQKMIAEEMKKGISYAKAVQNIAKTDILATPNNVLAIEYLKNCDFSATAVKRIGKGHDTDDIFYSASAIREELRKNNEEKLNFAMLKNCENAILYKLRTMSKSDFLLIPDVTEGLENKIVKSVAENTNLDDIIMSVKSKRYTHARIRRIILRAFLGITKDDIQNVPYLKILAFNENGRNILTDIKEKSSLPIITKHKEAKELSGYAKYLYEKECMFTDIYSLMFNEAKKCCEEQRNSVIKI